jgi:hypothetical protein
MTKVYTSSVIGASAEQVWNIIRDVNGMTLWHPLIAVSRIEDDLNSAQVGCVRDFQLKDGGKIREKLLALSDYDFSFTYSILESPMALENYVATLKLTPITDGQRCVGEWTAEFDCASQDEEELCVLIGQSVFQGGFDALKARFG